MVVLNTQAALEAQEAEMTQGLCIESERAQKPPTGTVTFTVREKQGCGKKPQGTGILMVEAKLVAYVTSHGQRVLVPPAAS